MTADAGRIVVDTSAAVPLLLDGHPAYPSVRRALGEREPVLAAHSLAETYAVLTRLPHGAHARPEHAARVIDAQFGSAITLPDERQRDIHRILSAAGIAGGATYDALVAFAASHHGLPLLSRDARARGTYSALGVATVFVSG